MCRSREPAADQSGGPAWCLLPEPVPAGMVLNGPSDNCGGEWPEWYGEHGMGAKCLVTMPLALSGASSPAALPAQSAEQLVADIAAAKPPQLSGALQWTVNLGFSGLSALEQEAGQGGGGSGSFDPLSLLSDDYQVDVWLDGATAEHLALVDGPAQEVDLVRNGCLLYTSRCV